MLRIEFEQNLAANEQTGPINKVMQKGRSRQNLFLRITVGGSRFGTSFINFSGFKFSSVSKKFNFYFFIYIVDSLGNAESDH
jgi:hypothetical protein